MSVGEENEAFLIKVWKLLPSKRVLKPWGRSRYVMGQNGQYLLAVGLGCYNRCVEIGNFWPSIMLITILSMMTHGALLTHLSSNWIEIALWSNKILTNHIRIERQRGKHSQAQRVLLLCFHIPNLPRRKLYLMEANVHHKLVWDWIYLIIHSSLFHKFVK